MQSKRPVEQWLEQSVSLSSSLPEQVPASTPAFGAKVVQNGRSLEDTYSVHIDFVSLAAGNGASSSGVEGGVSGGAIHCACARADAPDVQLQATSSSDVEDTLSWFGVYDGHGGKEVAQFAEEHLHRHFLTALAEAIGPSGGADPFSSSQPSSAPNSASSAILLNDEDGSSEASGSASASGAFAECLPAPAAAGPAGSPDSPFCSAPAHPSQLRLAAPEPAAAPAPAGAGPGDPGAACPPSPGGSSLASERRGEAIGRALRQAFMRTDRDLAGTEVGELVGSTALVAVVGRSEVHLAHCGDSRAVLCRRGAAVSLTSDHKPSRKDEAARVKASGGRVVFKAGAHRVMGLLAMSRALGDHFLRPYVIADPEVTTFQRSGDDEMLLLATDGLWDVFDAQEAVNLALRSAHRARERGASRTAACRVASNVLARAAVQRGSRDNITVVLVDLRRGPDTASLAAVLAAQCSEEVALTPQRTLDRRTSRNSDTGIGSGSGGGAGGGASSWLSGLLLRHNQEQQGTGGGGGRGRLTLGYSGGSGAFGAGATAGGNFVFRASGAASRGARMSMRRASTVTPIGVCMRPQNEPAWVTRRRGAAKSGDGAVHTAHASQAAARVPGVQRSLSFSSVELGHVLRRTKIECDAPAPPLAPQQQEQQQQQQRLR